MVEPTVMGRSRDIPVTVEHAFDVTLPMPLAARNALDDLAACLLAEPASS